MPGLVGLVSRMPPARAHAELRRMLGAMRHEAFYSSGTWSDEGIGVYVGWTALPGSFSDSGPQRNETGDVVLLFSGEDLSGPDLAASLRRRGHRLDAAQSSYLVHLTEEDPAFAARLNGLFHGVLVDRRRRTVTLFNDRFGMHRLYWRESNEALYFAAEAKAILAICQDCRRIDERGLAESIALGCVLENRTLFTGLHVLPGASAWTYDASSTWRKKSYFTPQEWEDQEIATSEAFYVAAREVFETRLPSYLRGPQRVGMSLTGGLDSRMIMAWQRNPPGELPCYTWGSIYRDCRDVLLAREVARLCHQPHTVITVGLPFLSHFAEYAERAVFSTDGCADVSMAPDVYMNEEARRLAPVRLTGLYGGEILRRVRAFKPVAPPEGVFREELRPHLATASSTYAETLGGHALTFAAFKQAPWHHYGSLCLEQSQVVMRSPFIDNEFVKAVYRAPAASTHTNDVSFRLIADGRPALMGIPTDRGLAARTGLSETLSHAAHQFLFKAEYAYDYGMPQWLARTDHAVRFLRLERLFLGRHKPHHFRIWYRDRLAEYVRAILLDRQSLARPYLQPETLLRLVEGHTSGKANHTTSIHKLLTLELIQRTLIEASYSSADQSADTTIAVQ